MEDVHQALQTTTDTSSSSSPLERRPSGEEDPAAMTIEFLRARLLSERSVSKAARERAQQLAKKVSELEDRLEVEIQLRKKLEADRLEILLKYKAELSEEYGDFFASCLGERDEIALGSPDFRKHDTNEEYVSFDPIEDGEGMPNCGLEQLDRSDSSQQLSREEANDDDDETDHSGQDKGVLLWGRRKGSRKKIGYGSDWLGRNLSQRSLTSNDGESPQKKWAGKSVRQIRKRESRRNRGRLQCFQEGGMSQTGDVAVQSYDTRERENGQPQVCEETDGIDQPVASQERLRCEDERDTEVERVLERQAELIEQYEAEENAQRAWEAKFKEGKALSNDKKVICPSKSEGKLEALTSIHTVQEDFISKHEATKPVATECSLSNESMVHHSRKVHPEDIPKGPQEELILSESIQKDILQEIHEPCSIVDQTREGKPDAQPFGAEKGTETREVENKDISGQVADAELSTEQLKEPTTELGKRSKYKKHLSSSFRFAVFPDAEPVAGSSPQMHGFTTYKQDEDGSEESGELNETRGNSGFPDAHPLDSDNHVTSTASLENQIGAIEDPLMGGCHITKDDADSKERGKDSSTVDIVGREKVLSHHENDISDSSKSADFSKNLSSDSVKEVENKRMKGLEGGQDSQPVQGRHLSNAPSHRESRESGGSDYLQLRHDYLPQPSKNFDGANFDNLPLHSVVRPGVHGSALPQVSYEETAFKSQHRSLDGFDRVADVLRALEIAKFQVQSSNEQDIHLIGDRNGYDGRDASFTEPPRLPSIYAAPPQPYMISAPYLSRVPAPYMHNMHGWGAVSTGYGVGSSRQVANAPYMTYPSRVPESRNMWPPPSTGVHNSNIYHYDTRPAQLK
ncbi:hypothetical protein L7F22_053171 [Adiantum nelumboides]|nr:hypothetical protein [Adiantum nelumboides]